MQRSTWSKLTISLAAGVVLAIVGEWCMSIHAQIMQTSVTSGQWWTIALVWGSAPTWGWFIVRPTLFWLSEHVADGLLQERRSSTYGARMTADWRPLEHFHRYSRTLDWAPITYGIARCLTTELPDGFKVRAHADVLSVIHDSEQLDITLGVVMSRDAKSDVACVLTSAITAIRDFVEGAGAASWEPAATASTARATVTSDDVSLWFEQYGRPTALLGTHLPIGWKAPAKPAQPRVVRLSHRPDLLVARRVHGERLEAAGVRPAQHRAPGIVGHPNDPSFDHAQSPTVMPRVYGKGHALSCLDDGPKHSSATSRVSS